MRVMWQGTSDSLEEQGAAAWLTGRKLRAQSCSPVEMNSASSLNALGRWKGSPLQPGFQLREDSWLLMPGCLPREIEIINV